MQLSPEQRERLREWWMPEDGDWFADYEKDECVVLKDEVVSWHCPDNNCLPLLSIGRCIELLKSRWTDRVNISESLGKYRVQTINAVVQNHAYIKERVYVADELIDALWRAVKEVL